MPSSTAATSTQQPPPEKFQSLKKELSGVCRACSSADAVNKHVDFVREYKQDFERDLDPESSPTFPATLADLTERLKHYKNILQSNVDDRFPAVLKLEDESMVLRDFQVVDVQVSGQYIADQASRDWGFAGDYVEAMWMMLQQDGPGDYVVATEDSHTVEEFLVVAFGYVGLNWSNHLVIDKRYFRPTEVDNLKGDASKAKKVLGWKPKVRFEQLVKMMVVREKVLVDAGFMDAQQQP